VSIGLNIIRRDGAIRHTTIKSNTPKGHRKNILNRAPVAYIISFFAILLAAIFKRDLVFPFIYAPFYLIAFFYLIKFKKLTSLPVFFLFSLITFSFLQLFSLGNIHDFIYSTVYNLMWIVNFTIPLAILKTNSVRPMLKVVIFYTFLAVFLLYLARFYSFNIFNIFNYIGVNINLIGFLLVFSLAYSIQFKKYTYSILIIVALVLTNSRTALLMMLIFLFLHVYSKLGRVYRVLILSCASVFFLFFAFINADYIIILTGYLTGAVDIPFDIEDERRLSLILTSIKTILELFPFGTGMGLSNYEFFAERNFDLISSSGSKHIGLAHNFYLTYTALIGIMIIPLLFILLFPLIFKIKKYGIFAYLYFSFLIGIFFNEYITSPVFWMAYGLALKEKIYYLHNKKTLRSPII
jgi:O-antigen ligase